MLSERIHNSAIFDAGDVDIILKGVIEEIHEWMGNTGTILVSHKEIASTVMQMMEAHLHSAVHICPKDTRINIYA